MKNPLPDTIAFRAMALLVVGLAVTHLVSNLFYATDRESELLSSGGEHAIQWAATVGSFSGRVDADDWRDVLLQANNNTRFVTVSNLPLVREATGGGWREETLQRELASHVEPDHLSDYRISYVNSKDTARDLAPMRGQLLNEAGDFPEELILLSLDLGAGKWLNMASPILSSPPFFTARLGLSMAVMLIAVVAISALLVRRMTAPLKQLSKAAEKLGKDVQASAIPETGPGEVRRTAHAFNVMQNRIRRFVEDRTQMLGAIAHDLGTPITRLRLRAEFVEDDSLRRKMLRDLDDMQHMVVSTLSFIREDATSEPRATVDIGSLLARVCDDIIDAGFDVSLQEVPRWLLVECRPVALRRALSNLVDNAVKYGRSASVRVVVEPETLRIFIEDNGPGIAKDRQEDVFRPFFRLEDSRNRETGGTGLGLSVARTIVRGHGGDIRLENREQGGLRVELRLPLSKELQEEPAPGSGNGLSEKDGARTREPGERKTEWKTL
ncbi:MAG: ATP-binding protein [Rhodobacteraceae bacterium]|nr:ATP-binding protein [Paracoccaceae bacterium]